VHFVPLRFGTVIPISWHVHRQMNRIGQAARRDLHFQHDDTFKAFTLYSTTHTQCT